MTPPNAKSVYRRPKRASCQTSETASAVTIQVVATVLRVFAGNCRQRSARLVLRSNGSVTTATAPHTASGDARNAATGWPRPRSIPAWVPPQNGHGSPVSILKGHTVWGIGSQARTSRPDATAVSRAKALCPGLRLRHHAGTPQNAVTIPLAPRLAGLRLGQVCHVWPSAGGLASLTIKHFPLAPPSGPSLSLTASSTPPIPPLSAFWINRMPLFTSQWMPEELLSVCREVAVDQVCDLQPEGPGPPLGSGLALRWRGERDSV